ncbi:hypothetical protein FHS00_000475 [Limimaricola variabilis]|uniref:Uncharacterized protein n=1 Tax=Limimaricola variabilis TaxID=1492771 RepID=A0ABR6HK99_9RHOB|nr:hypothetical protein [Limimaricola variabilis]
MNGGGDVIGVGSRDRPECDGKDAMTGLTA